MTRDRWFHETRKRMYRKALIRGISHEDVLGYIKAQFQVSTSKQLTDIQLKMLLKWLDAFPILPEVERIQWSKKNFKFVKKLAVS